MKKICFIINPTSGINRDPDKIIGLIHEAWQKNNLSCKIVKTEGRGHAIELAKEAVKNGTDLIVAVGGDGTINEVGRGLINATAVMGVVPAGSGNGFARNFGIPLDQKKAIEMLRNPIIRKIDVGKINDHYFFNVAGIGLDAIIASRFEKFGIRGPLPYFLVGVREFFRYQPEAVTVILDQKMELRIHPLILSIANCPQYGNGAIIAPQALPDDGLLDFCLLKPISVFEALWNVRRLFNGTVDEVDSMQIHQAASARIIRTSEGYIHTDGDPHLEGRTLEVSILKGHLQVAVGASD